jgi:hypothetical protein
MKKLIVLAALMIAFAAPASAGFLTNLAAGDGEGTKESTMYKLDTYGNDVRVYEWTPRDNPNVRCVFVAGSTNSTGVACYEVEEKEKK